MTAPVTLNDAIGLVVDFKLNNLHTALPGSIISYDYTKQKAVIQPLLNKAWTDSTIEVPSVPYQMPILNNVPVIFPRSGGASLTFPVSAGDTCLLIFIERSTDLWKTQGGQVTPDDNRKFDLSDAVAIMGLFPFTETSQADNNSDVKLTYAGSTIRIKSSGEIVLQTDSTIAIGTTSVELIKTLTDLFTSVSTAGGFTASQVFFANAATSLGTIEGTIP
jgi:hypothetical protein